LDVEALFADGSRPQRKSGSTVSARTGRYRRSRPLTANDQACSIAVDATLRQAAGRHAREGGWSGASAAVSAEDLRAKEFIRPCRNLIVFVLDASESMGSGAEIRIRAAKGAVLALLRKAYESRSEVALVAFGGEHATVVLQPTSSVDVAKAALAGLPTGGATPFADGLLQAWQLTRAARSRMPGIRPVLVIISDGQANVPVTEGLSVMEELAGLAAQIHADGLAAILIDAAPRHGNKGEMRRVAARMGASYVVMEDLTAAAILRTYQDFQGQAPAQNSQ
jgi:Mg-chelatase subunit ChlD